MSLDITILGSDGRPKHQVSLGVDEHWRLLQLLGGKGGLLARLNDYYADAEFQMDELEQLIQEIAILRVKCEDDEQLLSFLGNFLKLAELAKREQQPLLVIAD